MFSVDVSGNVPLYGQQMCTWCGAASGQMTMNGYPDPAHRLFFAQVNVWNSIQAHNSTNPADSGWATDPIGLHDCMMAMNPPPAGHSWVVFSNPVRDQLMFSIFYWMSQNHYPVPVLINQGGHWVVIVGYQTDIEPTYGSSPVLQKIRFHDPEPHNVGTDTTQTAAVWYGAPFNGSIIYSGSWLNKYVAVIEPPEKKGLIKVKPEKRIGEKIISPAAAIEFAQRWIKEMECGQSHPILDRAQLAHIPPMVVREEIPFGSKAKRVPQYYVVPFGFKNELGECGARVARGAVIVNAFTGHFEEVTTFGKPMRYLAEAEARNLVASAMNLPAEEIRRATASLVFTPSDITHIRVYPFWKIIVGRRTIFVDQLGTIYGKLIPSIPGD